MDMVYIERGSCTIHIPGFPRWQVNNATSTNGMAIGSGSYLGKQAFLLGASSVDCVNGSVVKAWTEEVVVRRVPMLSSSEGHAPLQVRATAPMPPDDCLFCAGTSASLCANLLIHAGMQHLEVHDHDSNRARRCLYAALPRYMYR